MLITSTLPIESSKILNDLISSASAAKVHYEVWWAQKSEAKPDLALVMSEHSDFFRASADAHYTALFVNLAHLYDKRPDSSSLLTFLNGSVNSIESNHLILLREEYEALAIRAEPLITVRHKTVAHIDAKQSEQAVFASSDTIWNNQVREIVYNSAVFVAKLAGTKDLGAIGIARDRRLIECTLKLIYTLQKNSA
jgi:hypothetical protein